MNFFEYENRCDDHVKLAVEHGKDFVEDGAHPITDHYHFHKRIELIYVMRGSITMRTEYHESLTAKPGEMLVMEENMLHHTIACEMGKYIMLQLPEENTEQYFKLRGNHSIGSHLVTDYENRFFEKLCMTIADHKYTNGAETYLQNMIDTLLSGIIFKVGLVPKRKSAAPLLKHMIAYILENLDKPFTIQDIAKSMGYSPRSVSDLFSKHTNMKLKDYILIKRIDNAKRMLDERFSIAESCDKSGFGSLQNFHRSFKMYEGITPGEYQAKSNFQPGRDEKKYIMNKELYEYSNFQKQQD